MAVPKHLRHLPPEHPERILNRAMDFCEYRGFPVNDPEYGSAVGWGVMKALAAPPHPKYSKIKVACHYAYRACQVCQRNNARWYATQRLRPRSESIRTKVVLSEAVTQLSDWDLISFVASVGRNRAALMLRITWYTLDALLNEAVLRLRKVIEDRDEVDL